MKYILLTCNILLIVMTVFIDNASSTNYIVTRSIGFLLALIAYILYRILKVKLQNKLLKCLFFIINTLNLTYAILYLISTILTFYGI